MAAYSFSRKPIVVEPVETKYRCIKTGIPCDGTEQVLGVLDKYESRSMHGQLPIVWDRAEGFNVWDIAGNKWIDFTSTIFVTNTGHANPAIVEQVKACLEKPLIHTYAYATKQRAAYLKALIEFTKGDFQKAFLLSAGTEAVEAAVKLARMYGRKQYTSKYGIIGLTGNWHGRTLGAQMLSSNEEQKAWIGYQDEKIHYLPFPYEWELKGETGVGFFRRSIERLSESGIDFDRDICAMMFETFQGWGAVFYPQDYVKAAERFCRAHNILVVFDEMQSGFGRTGYRFGYEYYGIKPDMICCGKGMGSGLSVSGVLSSAEIMDLPEVGNMSSTHSANPLVCAAGLATLHELEKQNLLLETQRKGALFLGRLKATKERFPGSIGYVNGGGLVAALLFYDKESGTPLSLLCSLVAERCMQKGLLVVHTGRESIKLAPPLTISDDALKEGLDVLEECIKEVLQENGRA